jgi:uncharacterized protein DUF6384
MTTTEPAAEKPAAAPATLDDLMLAMDVVDTLRHRERLVERELNEEVREEQLIERLRALYKSQGMDVPDSVIAEGVKALKDSRFVYTPPKPREPPGWGAALGDGGGRATATRRGGRISHRRAGQARSSEGYDEPEILSSTHPICLTEC